MRLAARRATAGRAVVMMSMNDVPVPSFCVDARAAGCRSARTGTSRRCCSRWSTDFGCAVHCRIDTRVRAVGAGRPEALPGDADDLVAEVRSPASHLRACAAPPAARQVVARTHSAGDAASAHGERPDRAPRRASRSVLPSQHDARARAPRCGRGRCRCCSAAVHSRPPRGDLDRVDWHAVVRAPSTELPIRSDERTRAVVVSRAATTLRPRLPRRRRAPAACLTLALMG